MWVNRQNYVRLHGEITVGIETSLCVAASTDLTPRRDFSQ